MPPRFKASAPRKTSSPSSGSLLSSSRMAAPSCHGYMNFYAVDFPHCHARIHPQLPGDIVDVQKIVGR